MPVTELTTSWSAITKIKKNINGKSHAIGLENIRKRYEYFTSTPIEIINKEKFKVMLPFLNV